MRRLAILTVTGGVVGVNIFFNNHFISMSSEETIPSSSSTSSKCPVAFLWNWSGSSLPSLPAGHPIISKNIDDEKPAVFNSSHFPNGVNANFLGSDPQTCAAKFAGPNGLFECESRQIKKYAPNIINTLKSYGLNEGSIVGDVGAGTGVLTRLLSRIVGPNGTVIAEELAPSFLTLLEEEKKKTPSMRNVTLVQGTNKQINFPNDLKCDLIVVCDVYHHFEYPVTTIRDIKKSLKPNGKLVVIDFHKDESKMVSMPKGWVTDHVRGTQDEFRKEIESAGFRLLAEPVIEGMTENYCMVFVPN